MSVKSAEMDVLLEIQSSDGIILTEDDDSGTGTDALVAAYTLPDNSEYRVIVSSWGNKSGEYNIQLGDESTVFQPIIEDHKSESDIISEPTETLVSSPTSTTEVECPGAPQSRLDVGMTAQQSLDNDPIRVRAEPRSGTTVQYLLYPDQRVIVIGGPECNALDTGGALVWWEIENSDGLSGWVAEGTNEQYFIVPID